MNFTDAEKNCNQTNFTTLAVMNTTGDYIDVRKAIDTAWKQGSPPYHWIGLNQGSKGWRWGGNISLTIPSAKGQKNRTGKCAALNVNTLAVHKMYCNATLPYVCVNLGDD